MLQKLGLIIIISCCLAINFAKAQAQRFKAGVIIGANLSQIDGDKSDGYLKLGITGGLRGAAIITEKIDLSIELLFDQRGSRSQKIFDTNFFPFKITNNYISVPVVFNYQDWLDESEGFYKLHFHTGLSYGRLLNTQIDDEDINSIFVEASQYFNRDDFGILLGATFYINQHIAVTGRFSRSLLPLYDYDEGDPGPISPRPFISKHLTIQLLYMF